MTYGDLKDFVLQLINQYSVAGSRIPLTYNDQADLVARIPALMRDGLTYVVTTARRLRAVAPLTAPREQGGLLIYDLPNDFYQLAGGLLRWEGGTLRRYQGYRLLGGRQVAIPREDRGQYQVEYFRYPRLPQGTPMDDDRLDCPPEAQPVVAYYVAAHLAMEDNTFLYAGLYNEFERRLARLEEGPTAEVGLVEDSYDCCG